MSVHKETETSFIKQMLTLPLAAKKVGLPKELFYYYVKEGRGPPSHFLFGKWLFEPGGLEGWKPLKKRATNK